MKFLIISIFIVSFIVTYCIIRKILNKNSTLLEAEANRAIAENSLTFNELKMSKKLRPVIRHINKAALNGRNKYSPTEFENMVLIGRFDKTQLKDFFKSHGYQVEFTYTYCPDSDIDHISWLGDNMSNVSEKHGDILERIEEIESEIAFLSSLAILIRDKFQSDPSVNPDYIQAIDDYAVNRNYKLQDELSGLKIQEKVLYDRMMTED